MISPSSLLNRGFQTNRPTRAFLKWICEVGPFPTCQLEAVRWELGTYDNSGNALNATPTRQRAIRRIPSLTLSELVRFFSIEPPPCERRDLWSCELIRSSMGWVNQRSFVLKQKPTFRLTFRLEIAIDSTCWILCRVRLR